MKILILEDDEKLLSSISAFLNTNGLEVLPCLSADEAYTMLSKNIVSLIISDIMMAKVDGFEFAQQIRNLDKDIPIIFMTARDDFEAKERGFKIGIDDFIVKPVNFEEMLFRIKAIMRRVNIKSSKKLELKNVVLNEEEHSLLIKGELVNVTVREFNILYKMLSYPKKIFTRQQLMDEFWVSKDAPSSRTVDVYMTKLRDKVSGQNDFEIVTVYGLGYKVEIK